MAGGVRRAGQPAGRDWPLAALRHAAATWLLPLCLRGASRLAIRPRAEPATAQHPPGSLPSRLVVQAEGLQALAATEASSASAWQSDSSSREACTRRDDEGCGVSCNDHE